ncbi:MAG: FAD-binding oxidoreductase [Deltaproteobacteria bacterium]|nr:FAD-binding oxidoreductase [Deltaproteobacteria bacterium]
MEKIYTELKQIVGSQFVSNRPEELFIYSRDMGTMPPANPDFVVMPDSTAEVQKVVLLANREGMPVVPMGAGLVLSGLTRALKGGIIMDMKRMNRILQVNEISRYAVVQAGASEGMLQAYLKRNHPALKHSVPDAPPIATIAGNVLIHGSGHLSQTGGFHSEMLNGLEVVLPTGEIVTTGSCSASPYWFSRAPLPDLCGLFIGWAGTTGVVTKLAVKLYPDRPFNDARVFITEGVESVPDIIHRLTGTLLAEDITVTVGYMFGRTRIFPMVLINYGADSKQELYWKKNIIRASVKKYLDEKTGAFVPTPPGAKTDMLKAPNPELTRAADERKGGGFEYVGAIMPIELLGNAFTLGVQVAEKFSINTLMGARVVGGHCMMFSYTYSFNRAVEAEVALAGKALHETNRLVLDLGGIPWKAEAPAQKEIIKRMDPNTFELMNRLRAALDPKGILNPGNWEVDE